jgi:DNA (cytosine-5)-methyltransferase 1
MLIKIGYKSRHKQAKPRYIDLFAGCGGLSLGLHQAGWQGIFAVEKSPDAFATLKHNLIDKKNHFDWPSWLGEPKNLEINTLLRNHKPELLAMQGQVDLVAGGPPCQGFSTAGRRNPNDGRNMLIKSYVDFIQLVMPKLIFFENVKGFTIEFKQNREKGKLYSKYVVNALRDLGYAVKGQLIDFGSYGLPQKRTRFILVGIRNGIGSNSQATAESFFANLQNERFAFLSGKGISVGTTLQDAISDLSMRHGTVPSHETPRFREGIYSKPSSAYQVFLRQDSDSRHVDSHRFANHKPEILKNSVI